MKAMAHACIDADLSLAQIPELGTGQRHRRGSNAARKITVVGLLNVLIAT